ncbi:DUF6055 domain-containing protein [Cellulomonas wangsupingiae]|uniref:DUF6055 domain-containing protein n=1 Tax=Cellulomonas wangsupingiae TaxID=2968085 RepID=A0ABY5K7A2_9CELL|nr:DUF6055 domain-containing protein [Cellulomonas wangsupingiae]MCC2334472.1 DUF6055 domain-containing protein [Cellulomonas wangsupingiae]UUI66134.1 DUF6055 domain-containing protein [Cellulomonas wangsupingiae]
MGPIRRGTAVVALVVAFVLGAALATALADRPGASKDVVVPDGWRAAWADAHVLEGDDVVLAWGDRTGKDPTAAPEGLRFDPGVVLEQLQALHTLDVDALGLGARDGPLADRKLVVVVDGTWSRGPGAPADDGGTVRVAGDGPTTGAVVGGVGLLRVDPAVLAPSLDGTVPVPEPSGPSPATTATATPALPQVPPGTPWELARGVAETVQHLTEAAHPGHGLTAEAAAVLRVGASAYLATLAVPGEHADVAEHVRAPHLAWGSPRHGAAGWLLLQDLADRSGPTLLRDLWTRSSDTEDLFTAYTRLTSSDASDLNRRVGQYAMRAAVADVPGTGPAGTLLAGLDPVLVAHRTTPVEHAPDDPGLHRVTGSFAPAAYGYTVVRLVPDGSGADLRVRVRGHVDAVPHAGWSVGVVALGPDGPRYSPVTEATDTELRLALRPGETEAYLVVTATPSQVAAAGTTGFPATVRYPYEFRVAGASVAEPAAVPGGRVHPHGGGWVDDAASVDPAAYVGAGAVVRGDAVVGPGVRLEGRAWVEAGARLSGDVVVRDAAVVRGSARLSGRVVVGGDAVVGFTCDAGTYTAYRHSATCDPAAVDSDVNRVVVPFAAGETALSEGAATTVPPDQSPGATPQAAPSPGASTPRPSAAAPSSAAPGAPDATRPGVAPPPAAVPAGACTAEYQVTTSWPGGVQAQVTVTATTTGVRGWTVTWTQPPGLDVTEQWGAEITRSGTTVTADNLSWNGAIADGASATFGFNATASGDEARAVPELRCTRTG